MKIVKDALQLLFLRRAKKKLPQNLWLMSFTCLTPRDKPFATLGSYHNEDLLTPNPKLPHHELMSYILASPCLSH
jgi:hypothetical protein